MKSFLKENRKQIFHVINIFIARIASFLMFFIANTIVARNLGPSQYGNFKIVTSVALLLMPVFEFGIFSSVGYIVANSNNDIFNRKIVGTSIIISIPILFLYGITYTGTGAVIPYLIKGNNTFLTHIFLTVSVLASTMVLQLLIPQISQGLGKPHILWTFYFSNALLYLIAVGLLYLHTKLTTMSASLAFFGSALGASILSIYISHPILKNLHRIIFYQLFKVIRSYGTKMYMSQLTANLIARIDTLVLASIKGAYDVGIYGILLLLTFPIVTLSQSIGIVAFREIARSSRAIRKFELLNYLWLMVAGLGLLLSGKFLIIKLFGDNYADSIKFLTLAYMMGFAHSWYQIRGSFLAAQGYGKETMISSLIMATVELTTIYPFTKWWGIRGLLISMTLSYTAFGLTIYMFSNNVIRRSLGHEDRDAS